MKKEYALTQRKGRKVQVMFDGTNRWVSSGCSDFREAELWAEANKRRFLTNTSDADIKLRQFAKDFWERTDLKSIRKMNERRRRMYNELYYIQMTGRLKNFILPALGHLRLVDLTPGIIEDWYLGLRKLNKGEMADSTKNKVLTCLTIILDTAVKQGYCESNPCDKVDMISPDYKERIPFSEEELMKLFPVDDVSAVDVWGDLKWACYFYIMRCTGFRPGEIAGLKRENFYPELSGIYTIGAVNSFERRFTDKIKTTGKGKNYKVGILNSQTCRLLKIYEQTLPESQEYMFLVNDLPMTAYTSNKHFRLRAEKAGVVLNGRTQYSLRHTFQTQVAGEIDRVEVEELMGHTKFRKNYDHRDGERRLKQLQPLRETLEEII